MDKKLLKKFNQTNVNLVVSGYPQEKKGGKNYGIAWYTKQILEPIAKKYNQKFVVLGEKNSDYRGIKSELKAGRRILVLRVFNQKKISLYPEILKILNLFPLIKNVYVHSEFGMSGNLWHFGLIIPFLTLIRLKGKKVYFFAHNIIDNVNMLSGHLNLVKNSFKSQFLNLALRFYYKSLSFLSTKIIVLDQTLKKRLSSFISKRKIITTILPVSPYDGHLTKEEAKEKLGIDQKEKVLLYFGFLTWYKGVDWLIETFNQIKQTKVKIRLVLAGGPSYTLANQPYYQNFYRQLVTIAKQNPLITITGFVADKDLVYYFRASEALIMPYRGLMGASGVLTQAINFQLPFFISKPMGICLDNYWEKLINFNLKKTDLNFDHTTKDLKRILNLIKDENI